MTDLGILAFGFGAMPVVAIILYNVHGSVLRHREATWGFLSGVIGFLGLSHAMALVLFNHSRFGDAAIGTALSFVGLVAGASVAWLVLEGPFVRTEPNRIVWAAVAFVALHSIGDGLVLGGGFISVVPVIPIDTVTVAATAVHRFLEGCVIVVPAIWASLKARSALGLLFASLTAIPATFLPGWIYGAYGPSSLGVTLQLTPPTLFAAMEATLGLLLFVRAFLPIASADRGSRWPLWVATGFIAIGLVHFLVE
jgi:hypothetical protein